LLRQVRKPGNIARTVYIRGHRISCFANPTARRFSQTFCGGSVVSDTGSAAHSRSLRSAGLHTFWHSNLSTTADIYKHTSAEAERDAAVAVERAIYGDLFPIVPKTGNRNNQTATCKEGKTTMLYS